MSITLEAGERKKFRDFRFVKTAIELGNGDIFAGMHLAVEDARDGEASEIVAVIEVGDQNLQRPGGIALGLGNRLQDRVEERAQVLAAAFDVAAGACPILALV